MERQKFDEEWREAFQAGERTPSESVWTNIELELERESGGKIKRRLLFFQLLAAASMVFAMGIGSIYYLNSSGISSNELPVANKNLSASESEQSSLTEEDNRIADTEQVNEVSSLQSQVLEQVESGSLKNERAVSVKTAPQSKSNESVPGQTDNPIMAIASADSRYREIHFSDRGIPSLLGRNPSLQFDSDTEETDAGEALLTRLKEEERKYKEAESKSKNEFSEKLWTSVGIGAGTYNPNASTTSASGTNSGIAFASGGASSSNPTAGSSYSVGVAVGGRIAKRLVIQGGLTYLTQNAEYTSSAASGTKVALNEISLNADQVNATAPYEVNSNMQYLSIPVQAGYYLLDRDFAIQVNGGVSTDFFLRNTLSADDSQFDNISAGPGEDSPYRSINFSGLLGTELSYRFSDHYRVAVNPGLRYALNSVYKSDVSASLSPVTFDVAVRFKYVFSN